MLAGSTAGCRQHTGQLEKQHCTWPRCRQGCQLVGQRICLQGGDQLPFSFQWPHQKYGYYAARDICILLCV